MNEKLELKLQALRRRLKELESAVVAFSGGVDSSVLAYAAAKELGSKMMAVTAESASLPGIDRKTAVDICREHAIPHKFLRTCEFDDPVYTANPEDRCYHCKKHLYVSLVSLADELGFKYVVEGTNASDLSGHRPGYKASNENPRVVTPLIDVQLNKEEVRALAEKFGLGNAMKPSSACLSSRVPTGVKLEPAILKQIDEAEEIVRGLGVSQVRVRHHGELARIEAGEKDVAIFLEKRREIVEKIGALGWKIVTLDLKPYGQELNQRNS